MKLLAINTSTTDCSSIELPRTAERYTLSAEKIKSTSLRLNGHKPKLGAGGELPALKR